MAGRAAQGTGGAEEGTEREEVVAEEEAEVPAKSRRGEPGGCAGSGRGPAERAGRREEPLCEARRVGPGRPPAGSRRPRPRRTDKHSAALPLSRSHGGRPPPSPPAAGTGCGLSRAGARLAGRRPRPVPPPRPPCAPLRAPRTARPAPLPRPRSGPRLSYLWRGQRPPPRAQRGRSAAPAAGGTLRAVPPPPRCGALGCPRHYPIPGLTQAPAALTSSSFLLLAGPRCAAPGRLPPRGPADRQHLRAGGDTRSRPRPLPLRFPRAGVRLSSLLLQLLNEGSGATSLPLE